MWEVSVTSPTYNMIQKDQRSPNFHQIENYQHRGFKTRGSKTIHLSTNYLGVSIPKGLPISTRHGGFSITCYQKSRDVFPLN